MRKRLILLGLIGLMAVGLGFLTTGSARAWMPGGIYKGGLKLVTGSAKTAGKRVTFADQGGRAACHGSRAVGIYRWRLVPGLLTLTPLSERCAGRLVVLSSRPLARK